jgi:hypothetical protein
MSLVAELEKWLDAVEDQVYSSSVIAQIDRRQWRTSAELIAQIDRTWLVKSHGAARTTAEIGAEDQ